jgi:hypothetical protein
MLISVVAVILAAAAIKFVIALCGHRITLRLAAVLALLIALLMVLCL